MLLSILSLSIYFPLLILFHLCVSIHHIFIYLLTAWIPKFCNKTTICFILFDVFCKQRCLFTYVLITYLDCYHDKSTINPFATDNTLLCDRRFQFANTSFIMHVVCRKHIIKIYNFLVINR